MNEQEKMNQVMPRIPGATYRLQFNRAFTFSDALAIVPYLHDLGVTDIYSSPYFKAKKGSPHGYDIVDPNMLNPEMGTERAFGQLIEGLRARGMGQILDIVPNHMCVFSADNVWWMDVLESGPSSSYAEFFDIDWDPVKKELANKVLIPVLGDQYGAVLENQELRLAFEEGVFSIYYYDNRFPLRPKTYSLVLEEGLGTLKETLGEQHPDLMELLSIITALRNLPSHLVRDSRLREERQREKEIVKMRLARLYRGSPEIKAYVDDRVERFNGRKGEPESFDLLDHLLDEQLYRLSFWRVATDEINYRRFFDINELAAVRMEDPRVYRETHRLLFRLIREGCVTGLRVDHADGLYDPSDYFNRLFRDCLRELTLASPESPGNTSAPDFQQVPQGNIPSLPSEGEGNDELLASHEELLRSDPSWKPFYIIAEKILIKGERMPEEWSVFSTTGYVFLNSVSGIFVDMNQEKAFSDIYSRFIKSKQSFSDVVYENKKLVMQVALSSEISVLGHHLNRISERDRHTRDFTLNSLISAIVEVIAYFPVYRTYITKSNVTDRDRRYVEIAIAKAKRKNPALSGSIFDFLKHVLLLRYPDHIREDEKRSWVDFAMRFQQITGPIMAKGFEDTACYVYNRLVSLNEVGGSPDRFGTPLETFHGQNIERNKYWPHALIATSTHDTKRSEDVRARLNVLSEIPREWRHRLFSWGKLNQKKKTVIDGRKAPDRNEEYLLYQTLIGTWPLDIPDETAYETFRKRIREYMLKAAREAKVNTSWINPDPAYEEALLMFVDAVLQRTSDNRFLRDFASFQQNIAHWGMFNALSQTLLKIAAPGVPDFYQGTETWNFCLVDPDNRRPVDYPGLTAMLDDIKKQEQNLPPVEITRSLLADMSSGMIKLFLIYRALNYRRKNRKLFEEGEYLPLDARGSRSHHICSFARRAGNRTVIAAVPRYFTKLIPPLEGAPLGTGVWRDSFIAIPFANGGSRYANIFTEEVTTAEEREGTTVLALADVFRNFPVSLMERIE